MIDNVQPFDKAQTNKNDGKSKSKKPTTKGKKASAKSDEPQETTLTQHVLNRILTDHFITGNIQIDMPENQIYKPQPYLFYKRDEISAPRILKICQESKTCRELSPRTLREEIGEYLGIFCSITEWCKKYALTGRALDTLVNHYIDQGPRINDWPKPVAFKSENKLAFKRLPFDPIRGSTADDFPTINTVFSNMTNSKNFAERVGSIFDYETDRKKIIYLVGKGDSGKSTLLRVVKHLSGGKEHVAYLSMKTFTRFGYAPLLNKRVWIGEEINTKFFQDEAKTLAGNEPLAVERKNEPVFNADMDGLQFFASNKMPKIEDWEGWSNRLIICNVNDLEESKKISESKMEKQIWKELPFFTGYCLDCYADLGEDKFIKAYDTEVIDNLAEVQHDIIKAVFSQYFEINKKYSKSQAVLTKEVYYEQCSKMFADNPDFARKFTQSDIDQFRIKVTGIKPITMKTKINGKFPRFVWGLKAKVYNYR